MPPIPQPFSPETIASEEEVSLLCAGPTKSREKELEAQMRADHSKDWTKKLPNNPLKIASITFLVVLAIFFLRRSITFTIIYEAIVVEVCRFFKDALFDFLTYIQDLDSVSGPCLLAVVYALCIVFFLPVTVLNLAAGFCFGIVPGFLSVSVGGVLGASLAFMLGRTIGRDMMGARVASAFDSSTLDNLLQRNPQSAFKIICLSRLPPCLPFPCVNYSYSMTNVPFWTYFWATWLGLAPGTFAYVYMGSAVRNLADVVSGTHSGGPVYFVVLALGVFGTFAVAIYLMREAQLALGIDKTTSESSGHSNVRRGGLFSTFLGDSGVRNRSGTSGSRSPRNGALSSPVLDNTPNPLSKKNLLPPRPADMVKPGPSADTSRDLRRDGDFLLFGDRKQAKSGRSKREGGSPHLKGRGPLHRSLTRNSSIWNLFKKDDPTELQDAEMRREAQHQAENDQLEYFL